MMPPTTWTITAADGSVRSGLTNTQARNALSTLMRGGTVATSKATPAPASQVAAEPQVVAAVERELVAA